MAGDLFRDWYNRTVTVIGDGTRDDDGAYLPGPSVVVPCQISEGTQLVRDPSGEQVASSATLNADLEWESTFRPGAVVEYVLGSRTRKTKVVNVTVEVGDDDLEGITVSLA